MSLDFVGIVVKKIRTKNTDGKNRARSWLETDKYISREGKNENQLEHVEFIDSTLAHQSYKERSREMESIFRLAPSVKNKADHLVLSFPEKTNTLPGNLIKTLVREFVRNSVYEGCDYVSFAHTDTNNFHVHLLVSRIQPTGKVIKDSNDYEKLLRTANKISKRFNIKHKIKSETLTQKPHRRERDRLYIKRHESKRNGLMPDQFDLNLIEKIRLNSGSIFDFKEKILSAGYESMFVERNGKAFGFKLRKVGSSNDYISGSSLSPTFGFGSLTRYFERKNNAIETKSRSEIYAPGSEYQSFEKPVFDLRAQPMATSKQYRNRILHNHTFDHGYTNRSVRRKPGISKHSEMKKWSILIGYKINNHLILLSLPNQYPSKPESIGNTQKKQFVSNREFFKS